jgi:hypothetical protein
MKQQPMTEPTNTMNTGLTSLPPELIQRISNFLDATSYARTMSTCHFLQKLLLQYSVPHSCSFRPFHLNNTPYLSYLLIRSAILALQNQNEQSDRHHPTSRFKDSAAISKSLFLLSDDINCYDRALHAGLSQFPPLVRQSHVYHWQDMNADTYKHLQYIEFLQRMLMLSEEGLWFFLNDGVLIVDRDQDLIIQRIASDSMGESSASGGLLGSSNRSPSDMFLPNSPTLSTRLWQHRGPLTIHYDPRPLSYVFNVSRYEFNWDTVRTLVSTDGIHPNGINGQWEIKEIRNEKPWFFVDGLDQSKLLGSFSKMSVAERSKLTMEELVHLVDSARTDAIYLHPRGAEQAPFLDIQFSGMRRYFDRCVYPRLTLAEIARAYQLPNTTDYFYFEVKFHSHSKSRQWKGWTGFTRQRRTSTEAGQTDDVGDMANDDSDDGDDDDMVENSTARGRFEATVGLVEADNGHYHPPGILGNSVGYQSFDGNVMLGQRKGESFQFGPSWGEGDVIGCGYIPYTPAPEDDPASAPHGIIFFTKNGEWTGTVPDRINMTGPRLDHRRIWFPAVGLGDPTIATVHFGGPGQEPFLYEPANYSSNINMDPLLLSLANREPTQEQISYLRENGYRAYNFKPNASTIKSDPHPPCTVHQIPAPDGSCYMERVTFPPVGYKFPRNVQCDYPLIPPNGPEDLMPGYYEVSVISGTTDGFMGLGLATKPYSPYYHVGWDFGSCGYHSGRKGRKGKHFTTNSSDFFFLIFYSDDGKLFDGAGQGGQDFGECYNPGDVVGVGLTPSGDVYFTRNGERVKPPPPTEETSDETPLRTVQSDGILPLSRRRWCLYPTISACGKWQVSVNFGQQEFMYNYSKRLKDLWGIEHTDALNSRLCV